LEEGQVRASKNDEYRGANGTSQVTIKTPEMSGKGDVPSSSEGRFAR